jgi:2-isopropylmalate synthase
LSTRITIFDTTLRDGEQSPGIALQPGEKAEIAAQLERLGVDVIEAGFPISSPGDFEGVRAVTQAVTGTTVAALARTDPGDLEAAAEAVAGARRSRIHVFIATSELHMARKLQLEPAEVLERVRTAVGTAAEHADEVQFSAEDASRSDPVFLAHVCREAIAAGATIVNLPDTVGYCLPDEHAAFLRGIQELCPELRDVVLSVHCHNDLGLAVANTLSGIRAGATQVECTVNGIGERAGNTSLEEVVMALRTRADAFDVHTDIDTRQLWPASQLVERLSGMPVQWNKAVVGKNAFRHGSGIHQDGILKLRETWEIMDPTEIGIPMGTQIVLGKLSGRHAFREHLRELGHELEDEQLERVFATFKALADEKVELDDRGLRAIVVGARGSA